MYQIPAARQRIQETIKRSKFIATVAHAPTAREAKRFIADIRDEFPDASHHCWAYVAGPPGDTARVGMSDDGEPHGTAGKPMLAVLLHSEIGEVAAVLTRYFGGTQLGTGGLVRAYSGCVKNALAGLPITAKQDLLSMGVTFNYSKTATVQQLLKSFNAEIIEAKYQQDVTLEIDLSKNDKDDFIRALTDLTGGKIRIT